MKLEFVLRRQANLLVRAARRALRRHGEEGTALVEFAMTAPILVAALTAMCSFAMGLYSLQQLGNATTNAVQTVAEYQGINTGTTNDSDPCALAASTVTAALSGWSTSNFSYSMTITYVNSSNVTTTATYTAAEGATFTCTAGSAELSQNYPVALTVTYAYSWLPILKFSPTSSLTSTQGAEAD
jgi:Flp pilus assembly protein TadG